jgi:hypothetical protein
MMRRLIVAALMALAMLISACGVKPADQVNKSSTPTSTPPAVVPTNRSVPPSNTAIPPLPNATTFDVREVRSGDTAHLDAVRLARHDGYDRLVLEFVDRVPGYTVGYRPLPARADGSGHEIPLPGANALVQVTLTPAAADWDYHIHDYQGPSTVIANTAVVTEAKEAGDFEAVLTWVAGLRAKAPFRVVVLEGPPRLVIDFQH